MRILADFVFDLVETLKEGVGRWFSFSHLLPSCHVQARLRSGCLHIDWECEDAEVTVDVEVSDRLSMLVRRIQVFGSNRNGTGFRLKKQADAAIDQLTYFDSSFRLIEWDQISNMVQVRGRPDRAQGVPPQYFEIIIDRSPSILLHRRFGHETIPFHISNDCFIRLIDDLVRIVRF